jgi:hypothetical protein
MCDVVPRLLPFLQPTDAVVWMVTHKNAKFRSLNRGSALSTESVFFAFIMAEWVTSSKVPKLQRIGLFNTSKIGFFSAIVATHLI